MPCSDFVVQRNCLHRLLQKKKKNDNDNNNDNDKKKKKNQPNKQTIQMLALYVNYLCIFHQANSKYSNVNLL